MSNASLIAELTENGPISDAGACMAPLLDALHWRGTTRQLAEASSTPWNQADIGDIRNTMAHLNYRSSAKKQRVGRIDKRLLPCLFKTGSGQPFVLSQRAGQLVAFDGRTRQVTDKISGLKSGTAYYFETDEGSGASKTKSGWFRPVMQRFEPFAVRLFVLSLIISCLALATPLFIKAVFDQVIGAKSLSTLNFLAIGIGMALFCDIVFRYMRSTLLSYIGGRMDNIVNTAVVDKIMDLPLAKLEKASVGAQLARLKEFEGMRAFFAGPIAVALMETPFVLIYVIAIAVLGGWLAAVPLVLMVLLGGGAWLSMKYSQAAVADSVMSSAEVQTTLIEILENMRFIKDEGTEDLWLERYRERSTQLAFTSLNDVRINTRFQIFAQTIMQTAAAITLTVGAILSIDGDFSVGSLIAAMALVWRVLAPIQSLFLTMTKLEEVKNAINRVDQLMGQQSETQTRSSGETIARDRKFEGRISFERVVLRYTANTEPALAGVSFNIEPGEVVAIIGSNGSGKSTILKLIANLYKPQAGMIKIDDIDTRQLNLLDLRNSIGYLPQHPELFAGTIEENLKVSSPVATRQQVEEACYQAGVLDDVQNLPQGLNTMLTEQTMSQVSTGFRKGLTLARAFLTDSNLMLFDEPSMGLDVESDEMLKQRILAYKGKATTLMVTHRSEYVQLADRVIALKDGRISFNGTPAELADMGKAA